MEIYVHCTQTFIAYEGFVELKTKFLIDCFTNYTGWIDSEIGKCTERRRKVVDEKRRISHIYGSIIKYVLTYFMDDPKYHKPRLGLWI